MSIINVNPHFKYTSVCMWGGVVSVSWRKWCILYTLKHWQRWTQRLYTGEQFVTVLDHGAPVRSCWDRGESKSRPVREWLSVPRHPLTVGIFIHTFMHVHNSKSIEKEAEKRTWRSKSVVCNKPKVRLLHTINQLGLLSAKSQQGVSQSKKTRALRASKVRQWLGKAS